MSRASKLVAVVLLLVVAACKDPLTAIVRAPLIVGQIAQIDTTDSTFRLLIVESRLGDSAAVWFLVAPTTVLLTSDGQPARRSAFQVGRRAAGTAKSGLSSYPEQAVADTLVVEP